MSADGKPQLLGPNTYVPLALVAGAVIFTAAVMSKLNAIENSIAELQSRKYDQWTATNMDSWIDKTVRRNPALNLPAVAEIKGGRISP